MKRRSTFWFSLGLNLALAGVAVLLSLKLPPTPAASVPPAVNASAVETILASTGDTFASDSVSPGTFITNRFEWRRIESEDFTHLAFNLRAIGCPEKTVRELVSARAVRALERLGRDTRPKLPFWTAGLRSERAMREAERAALVARDKIIASVAQVFGRDSFLEDPKLTEDFVEQAIVRFLSGPMSEGTFSRLRMAFARQEARREEISSRARGVMLEADELALEKQSQQLRAELASILSPTEFEEFTARRGIFRMVDEVCFEATDLTLAEIRQIGLLRGRLSFTNQNGWFDGRNLSDEQEAQLTNDLRQLFGAARYAQIERAADGDFKTLFDLGRDNNLPREVVNQAFELRQLTAQEVAALRSDSSLSEAERRQRLAVMQADAQASILKVLGATTCQQYLQRGGSWVTNVSGL